MANQDTREGEFTQAGLPEASAQTSVPYVTEATNNQAPFSQKALELYKPTSKPGTEDYEKNERNFAKETFTQVGLPEAVKSPNIPTIESKPVELINFEQWVLEEKPKDLVLNIVPSPEGSLLKTGDFQSPNFRTGQTGWRIRSTGDAEFRSVSIQGVLLATIGTFGGDGSDGALSVTGATSIDLGAEQIVTKNYTSISITGTGVLSFTNPHANGTLLILKSQGAVVVTSSATAAIDASGIGAAGGAGGASGASNANGSNGSDGSNGTAIYDESNHFGALGNGGAGAAGAGGAVLTSQTLYLRNAIALSRRMTILACGSGGGGGGGGSTSSADGPGRGSDGGAGGRGGAGLLIECRGALNFTGTISVAGAAGTDSEDTVAGGGESSAGGGGGGGGAGGMCAILYGSLTANTGTINCAGGAGGAGGDANIDGGGGATAPSSGSGGGGGGRLGAGGAGAAGTATDNANGSAGTAGDSTGGGGGGGSGATRPGSTAGTSTGGAGGAAGASENVYVAQNNVFA